MTAPKKEINTNPFPGLRPFREDEEHLFFGRETQIDAMVDKLKATRFLAVVGGSGSGKSSLVNCGLRPGLHGGLMSEAGTRWRMAQFRPGNDPLRALADALAKNGVLFKDYKAAGLTLPEIIDTTVRMSKRGIVDIYEQANLAKDENLLVVVDQFEELFRYRQLAKDEEKGEFGVGEEATAFVNLLLEAAAQKEHPIYVVLTMRSDFLGDCAEFNSLAEAINAGQYLVPRMTREERRAAISGPVGVGGAEISPVLLTRLVNDVGDNPDQLSILQHALNRTWASWEGDGGRGPVDLPHYEAIGTMAHALDQHAEQAFEELKSERQKEICEKIFKALTDKATDPRGVRRPTTLGNLSALSDASADEVIEVIEIFRDPSRSFLMPPAGTELRADAVVDISHESLMRVWVRLNEWGDEEAISARIYRRLAETSVLHSQGDAGLWQDPDLQVALGWQERNQPNEMWAQRYNPSFDSAMAFLKKSKAKRGRKRIFMIAAAAVVFLVLSGLYVKARIAESIALGSKVQAEKSKILADAAKIRAQDGEEEAKLQKRLADEAKLKAEKGEEEAKRQKILADEAKIAAQRSEDGAKKSAAEALIASAAAKKARVRADAAAEIARREKSEAETARDNAKTSEQLVQIGKETALVKERLAEDPVDGLIQAIKTTSLSQSTQGQVLPGVQSSLLSAIQTSREKGQIKPDGEYWYFDQVAVSSSRDSPMTVVTNDNSGYRLWNEAGFPLSGYFGESYSGTVAISSDGQTIVNVLGGALQQWDGNGKLVGEGTFGTNVATVAITRDGSTIVSGGSDWTVRLWDRNGQPIGKPFWGHADRVLAVAVSEDGKTIVSGSDDGTLRIWDAEGNTIPRDAKGNPVPVRGHTGFVRTVAISADGQTIVSGGIDQTVRIWDRSGRQIGEPLRGHVGDVSSVAISPDGKTIVSGGVDGTVRVWDLDGQPLGDPLLGHDGGVGSVAISADGKTVISAGGYEDPVRFWGLDENPIRKPSERFYNFSIGPDGQTVDALRTSDDQRFLLNRNGEPISGAFAGYSDEINCLAFSPDGKMIATGGSDKTVRLWDSKGIAIGNPFQGHNEMVHSVAFSPDGKTIVTGDGKGVIRLWDLNGKSIGYVRGEKDKMITSVALSPDGKTVISEDEKVLRFWDRESGLVKGRPFDRCKEATAIAFSADGETIACGSKGDKDKTLQIWSRDESFSRNLKGHRSSVSAVAVSPDGQFIASGSNDKSIRVWDKNGNHLGNPLKGHTESIDSISFSPDGRFIFSASGDEFGIWSVFPGTTDMDISDPYESWHAWLKIGCERLSLHPILVEPSSEKAVEACLIFGALSEETADIVAVRRNVADARKLAAEGKIPEAIAAFQEAQRLSPGIDLDPAASGVQSDPKETANSLAAPEIVIKGRSLASEGKFEEALKEFRRAQEIYPGVDLDPATYAAGIQSDPVSVARELAGPAKVSEAENLAWNGEIEKAIVAFEEAKVIDPNIDLDYNIGGIQQDSYSQARYTAAEGKQYTGADLAWQGEIEKAIGLFEEAKALNPEIDFDPNAEGLQKDSRAAVHNLVASGMVERAYLVAGEGKFDEAISLFNEARVLDPKIDLGQFGGGGDEKDTKSQIQAIIAGLKARNGREISTQGKIEEAVAFFKEAQVLQPQIDLDTEKEGIQSDPMEVARYIAAETRLTEANQLLEVDPIKALMAYENAKVLNPKLEGDASFLKKLARAKLQGDPAGALADCERANRITTASNDRVQCSETMAVAKALLGKTREAIDDLKQVIESSPNDEESNAKRQWWIDSLEKGQNPFTPELIKTLSRQFTEPVTLVD